MFSAIFSGIKAIFGAGKDGSDNVMKVATGVGSWIDEQKWTDQEKAVYTAQMADKMGEFVKNTITENSERSRTRRELAIWIIRVELLLLVFSVAVFRVDESLAQYAYKVATDSPLGLLTLGVGGFFFATHLVRATKGT